MNAEYEVNFYCFIFLKELSRPHLEKGCWRKLCKNVVPLHHNTYPDGHNEN